MTPVICIALIGGQLQGPEVIYSSAYHSHYPEESHKCIEWLYFLERLPL
jgi:hypothetical protein